MKSYYIQLFSPHGLIRYNEPEIGRDKDTGGQVKYVLELLEHLSNHPQVRKVTLFTRRILDKRVSTTYNSEVETVNEKARIVRIPCGGTTYHPKEELWQHLDEFVNKTIRFIHDEKDMPDVVHGHYADGNYIASQISEALGILFIATGHSLGRNKEKILLSQGLSLSKINDKFNMPRRIEVEENILKQADAVIVSTQFEIDNQYGLYKNKDEAHFEVIPPGVNATLFYPFYRYDMPSFVMSIEQEQTVYRINSDIERFLFNPAKPLILSIGRPDKRKNFETIIHAYGQDKELQAMADLAIFAGVRKDITQMPPDEQDTLTNLLLLMDKYDLYGKMAIPKKNDPVLEVPEIYRIAARKKGVFINATPGENFGLTIIEAAACGLPVVASPTGGPKEILSNCDNGLLVDVDDASSITGALKKIIADNILWERYSSNGILASSELYSWEAHSNKYLQLVEGLMKTKNAEKVSGNKSRKPYGEKIMKSKTLIISDLDGTLIDGNNEDGLKELKLWIEHNQENVLFGIASGRNRSLLEQAFNKYELPSSDILICSAGTEIYYTQDFIPDIGWQTYIGHRWKPKEVQQALIQFPGIRPQETDAQTDFKLSYYVNNGFDDDDIANLYNFLDDRKLKVKILLTENKYLDILPFRASKGRAVHYLSYKWQIPLTRFITAGNSGNDEDMLTGRAHGIVVSNYSPELEVLKKHKSVYFSKTALSKGILEGINFHLKQG